MKLSIIIPCYNEKNSIEELIRRVEEADVGSLTKEIIIVDDGSVDGTRQLLQGMSKHQIVLHDHNSGKGSAIRTGLKYVTGDIVVIQDADLEYNPQDYVKLIEPIIQHNCEIVFGTRKDRKNMHSGPMFYWGGVFLTWLTNILYGSKITDQATGYKVFKSDVIKKINLKKNGFEFCSEITAKVLKRGIAIREIPISYTPRRIEEGKKIRWLDGAKAIITLLQYRVSD